MNQFPTLTSGVICMTPATIGTGFSTRVMRFCDDTEQRWAARGQHGVFVLTFTDISGFDRTTIWRSIRTTLSSWSRGRIASACR